MKTIKNFSLLCLCVPVLAACSSSLKVTSDYNNTMNFTGYKTFNFYNLKTSESVSQLNADRIASAIRADLIKKGLQKQWIMLT